MYNVLMRELGAVGCAMLDLIAISTCVLLPMSCHAMAHTSLRVLQLFSNQIQFLLFTDALDVKHETETCHLKLPRFQQGK